MNNDTINNIVVLIDQFTRNTVKEISYDTISKHAVVITDIRELTEQHYGSTVVIFEPSLNLIATYDILKYLKNKLDLNFSVVYQDEAVIIKFKYLANCIYADYNNISWNFIYAVVNNDLAILEPYQKSLHILDSFNAFRSKLPNDLLEYIDRFRGSYLELVRHTDELLDDNSKLQESIKIQEVLGLKTIAGVKELKELLDNAYDKINSYEAILSESYTYTCTGFYPERPKIIYIKQISHVSGIDTLLSVLFAVFTKQYRSSCKIIKLVDSNNAFDIRYIPNNYVKLTDTYATGDLLVNDFLVKLGAYKVMFDVLLLNRSSLEYLIIHDMRSDLNFALDDTLIDLKINEISSDYAILREYNNILSDLKVNVDFPWDFKDCMKFTGSKSVQLANHPTVISILDLLI